MRRSWRENELDFGKQNGADTWVRPYIDFYSEANMANSNRRNFLVKGSAVAAAAVATTAAAKSSQG